MKKCLVAGRIHKSQAIGIKISKNQIANNLINNKKARAPKTKAAIIVKTMLFR